MHLRDNRCETVELVPTSYKSPVHLRTSHGLSDRLRAWLIGLTFNTVGAAPRRLARNFKWSSTVVKMKSRWNWLYLNHWWTQRMIPGMCSSHERVKSPTGNTGLTPWPEIRTAPSLEITKQVAASSFINNKIEGGVEISTKVEGVRNCSRYPIPFGKENTHWSREREKSTLSHSP